MMIDMPTYIWPYKLYSQSAKALAVANNWKRIRQDKVPPGPFNLLNWGASQLPDKVMRGAEGQKIINRPEQVGTVTNKRLFFYNYGGEHTVRWTFDRMTAMEWLGDGAKVVVRTVLEGHSGAGIVIIRPGDRDIPAAPLYTLYVPKKHEFRVHIVGNKVVDLAQKAKRHDAEQINWEVQNHANGFIYKRQDLAAENILVIVKETALNLFKLTGLDFGAVDVIYNEKRQRAYVLEVNTAPGLEGQTIQSYAEALKALV